MERTLFVNSAILISTENSQFVCVLNLAYKSTIVLVRGDSGLSEGQFTDKM